MRILALNPYHGGSHAAFLNGWSRHSPHDFTTLTLPAYKWKWRMRHAPLTLAGDVNALVHDGAGWDLVFCTDMLNLAEFRGLVDERVARLPAIAYFHENQLTYPVRAKDERDNHFVFSNLMTAAAADDVWFNSEFHRDEFLREMEAFLKRMPDFSPLSILDQIQARVRVMYPGVNMSRRGQRSVDGPIHIVWVSRWEHDKDPQTFFAALELLHQQGIRFRLSVLGERFAQVPACFARAEQTLGNHIVHWGYLDSAQHYLDCLAGADVVVATATHEFFGIAVLEAVAAGCLPLVPRRLAYPETLGAAGNCFYDGSIQGLANCLAELADDPSRLENNPFMPYVRDRFAWTVRSREMDQLAEAHA